MNNILVTAIGSMSADVVINSLRKNGYNVWGTDIYPGKWVGAEYLVGKQFYQVPLTTNQEYIPTILKICNENKIKYLQPLTDLEVDVLAENRKIFEKNGIIVCIATTECVRICRNKLKFVEFFRKDDKVMCIPTYTYDEIGKLNRCSKIVAKMINGRSSEGLCIFSMGSIGLVENKHQCVYQPYMKGDIFCVDVVEDSNGNSCAVARKELLRTKTGAGVTVELQNEKTIIALSKAVCDALNVLGCINMEFIRNNDTYYLMDINPRFSAGIGFSMLTGYDMVINHIKCFDGEDVEEQILYKNEIISKRYKVMC